jgi:hypothetical protein
MRLPAVFQIVIEAKIRVFQQYPPTPDGRWRASSDMALRLIAGRAVASCKSQADRAKSRRERIPSNRRAG